jgi:chromosome segregation ATPase
VALTELIPQDFNEYLVFNQKEKLQRDYAATQDSIDTVKSALIQAQQELNALKQNDVSNNNTDVIIIKARIDALQQSLNNEIANISSQSNNDLQAEYNDTIEQIKTTNGKIVEVSNQLIAISGNPVTDNTTNDPQIIVLQAKITALKTELDKEMAIFVTLTASGDLTYTDASASINNLAKELANANQQLNNLQRPVTNNTAIESPEYQIAQIQLDTLNAQKDALNKKLSQLYQQILNSSGGQDYLSQIRTQFSNTSADLTTAKNQLNTLEAQLGYNSTSNNLNIQVAQNKVDNLNQELDSLTKQLGTLVTGDINSLETDYLVAGTPSAPVPILPQRAKAKTSLMEGAVIGILLAWVFWNVRWFKAKLSSMGGAKHEAENKPQAQQ